MGARFPEKLSVCPSTVVSMRVGEIWQLYAGSDLVAELTVTDTDFPWLRAEVSEHQGFAPLRQMFRDELRLSERIVHSDTEDDVAAFEDAQAQIHDQVRLAYPDGRTVPEFLLHIDDHEAWWRWEDEPFEARPDEH
jgi:hypothetical protein